MLSKSLKYSAVVALGLACLGAVALSSPAQARGNNPITLRACNHTDDTLLVAASFIPVGGADWRNKGWTRVRARGCENIFTTTNRTFFARAEVKGDKDTSWGTDIKQCVEYPGPYDFYTASEDTTCPEGEPADFSEFHSNGSSVFVWDLK